VCWKIRRSKRVYFSNIEIGRDLVADLGGGADLFDFTEGTRR
jgi:hypothetical protein